MSPTLLWMLLTMAPNDPNAAPPMAPPPAAAACTDPAHRQFDFWLGEWTVHGQAGNPVGRSRIESVLGGWVDAQGGRLLLRGGLQGSAMVLASEDGAARQRITWTPNEDGSVRQLWEASTDAGATWTVAFDGLYRRAGG